MNSLSIIKFGTLSIEYGEKPSIESFELGKFLGKLGDSSVIHVEYEGKHYLIDTGFAKESDFSKENLNYNEKELRFYLELQGLKFEDINGVFITHWHTDHFGNLHLFSKAKIYCYRLNKAIDFNAMAKGYHFENLLPVIFLEEKDTFAGCQILPTPGHTRSHCSLLVEFMNLKVVIAGDAIVSQSYFDHGTAWPYNAGNLGEAACKQSLDKIVAVADYIIPGHGHPFQNYKKSTHY